MLSAVFRGTIVRFSPKNAVEIVPDSLVGVQSDGKIAFIENASREHELLQKHGFARSQVQALGKSQFLMPGLIDCHAHAPQYCNCGIGLELELLDWLNTYTFKEGTYRFA